MIPHSVYVEAAKQLNLPIGVVHECVTAYWIFLKKTIQSWNLKDDMTEEEFNNHQFSVNVPGLGKFGCTYKHYLEIKYGIVQTKASSRKPSATGKNRESQ